MDKVRNKGMNFNENRNSSCCGWSRSLIYIIKLTYLVGLSNTWNLYKMVCKRQNLIINGMVRACLDCFVVFNLVLACARLAIRALDKRLRKKSLRSEKASDFPAHFQKNRFSRKNVPCRSVSLPSTRATCNFFNPLSLLSRSLEQAANNVGIFREKLWRTLQKEHLRSPLLQELQMSHLPM